MSTTTRATSKSDLLAKIEHVYVASRAVVEALPAERWDEMLPAGWTLKEMVGHLAYWEETVPPFVESLRTGVARESVGTVDEQNAKTAAAVKGLSRDQVLKRWQDAHARMTEIVRSLNDDELADPRVIEKIAGRHVRPLSRSLRRPRRGHQDRHGAGASRGASLDPIPHRDHVTRTRRSRGRDAKRLDVQGPGRARDRMV